MATDDRLRDAMARAAAGVDPELTQNRTAIQDKLDRHHARRRLVVALVAALALLVVVVTLSRLDQWVGATRGVGPAGHPAPSHDTPALDVPNPFTVTRTFSPADLGLRRALRVALAPNGHLYVTDTSQTVTELSPRGSVLRRWGRPGSGPGEFRLASGGIAVGPDGHVFVADAGNFRVQVFSPTGRYLSQFGRFGRGPGEFLWPSDVAVDDEGAVYVTDDRTATVRKMSPSGREQWRLGRPGTSDPDLRGHEHLAQVDSEGRLLMANDDRGRVVYLDSDGHKVDAFGSGSSAGHATGRNPGFGDFPDGACDATTDPAGYVYVTSCQEAAARSHNTEVFDPNHRLVGAWLDGPFAVSPRFTDEGRAYVVSHDGSVLEVAVSRR